MGREWRSLTVQKLGMQRRSKRLPLSIPVRVYGRTANDLPFRYVTETNAVSVHGALLTMDAKVKRGVSVLLVNAITEEECECRVAFSNQNCGAREKSASNLQATAGTSGM